MGYKTEAKLREMLERHAIQTDRASALNNTAPPQYPLTVRWGRYIIQERSFIPDNGKRFFIKQTRGRSPYTWTIYILLFSEFWSEVRAIVWHCLEAVRGSSVLVLNRSFVPEPSVLYLLTLEETIQYVMFH